MSPIKKIMKRGHIYHIYYRRSGGYRFIGSSALKLVIGLAVVGAILYLFNTYVYDIADLTDYFTHHFGYPTVLLSLYLSETLIGILSPEIYIIWVSDFAHPWLWVLFLATISYLAGLSAYFIGTRLYLLPKVHDWVDNKFNSQFKLIRKYGGLLVALAALTPLPYPPMCMVSGMIKFPFKLFALITALRFVRFALYTLVLFKFV